MAARNGEWRAEISDVLFSAEHRDELRRVGIWAFDHVAKTEATGQIAAVVNDSGTVCAGQPGSWTEIGRRYLRAESQSLTYRASHALA